jgi:hypothetical protein
MNLEQEIQQKIEDIKPQIRDGKADVALTPPMIWYQPELGSPLHKLWPNGVAGEITHRALDWVHLRVRLEGHTKLNPRTAMIVVPWKRCKVM